MPSDESENLEEQMGPFSKRIALYFVYGVFIWIISWFLIHISDKFFINGFGEGGATRIAEWCNFFGELFGDVAIAIWVAIFVGVLIEQHHRSSLRRSLTGFLSNVEERISQSSDKIAIDVFGEVFKAEFSQAYKDEVILLAFSEPLIRQNLEIQYELCNIIDEKMAQKRTENLLLKCKLEYTVRNLSTNRVISVPRSAELPNPNNDDLLYCVRVKSYKSGPTVAELSDIDVDIDQLNRSMREEFKQGNQKSIFKMPPFDLGPGESRSLEACYDLVKEIEDNEVFKTRCPATSMTIRVSDLCDRNLVVDGEAIHPGKFSQAPSEDGDGKTHKFVLDRHFLPYQGVTVFWKIRPQSKT